MLYTLAEKRVLSKGTRLKGDGRKPRALRRGGLWLRSLLKITDVVAGMPKYNRVGILGFFIL
jgi:hypothetical protein